MRKIGNAFFASKRRHLGVHFVQYGRRELGRGRVREGEKGRDGGVGS